jgi:hypothetical protein
MGNFQPVLTRDAYAVQGYQIVGAPGWASSQGFDITFTPDKAEAANGSTDSKSTLGPGSIDCDLIRLQAVLRDRFGLVLRSETREMPIYNLFRLRAALSFCLPLTRGVRISAHGAVNFPAPMLRLLGLPNCFLRALSSSV